MKRLMVIIFSIILFVGEGFGQGNAWDKTDTMSIGNFSTLPLSNHHFCLDCNSSKAKKEFAKRWEYLDSICVTNQYAQSDDALFHKYIFSFEQITQIQVSSCDSVSYSVLDAWWLWFMMYSDWLCWDSYNNCIYIKPETYINATAKTLFSKPPQSPFGRPSRKSYTPLY